jgi:YHS domain-containing protein
MNKRWIFSLGAAFLLLVTLAVFAQVQSPDTAKDPVCGMMVKKATAKYTYDYKGTTYYFCSEGCKTSFVKEPEKYLAAAAETEPGMKGRGMGMMGQGMGMMQRGQAGSQMPQDSALDPVCGMMVKKATAKYTYDYKGTTYYFCSEGCKTSFVKEPEKYLAAKAETEPGMKGRGMGMMGQGMGMMQHGRAEAGNETCPFMLPDIERKVENTKTGVVMTFSASNPETVKKIQDHAAMMKDGSCSMMVKDGSVANGEAGCPMGPACPMKKK